MVDDQGQIHKTFFDDHKNSKVNNVSILVDIISRHQIGDGGQLTEIGQRTFDRYGTEDS